LSIDGQTVNHVIDPQSKETAVLHSYFGKSKALSVLISILSLLYGFESMACKRTAESAERAIHFAVLDQIKNEKDLSGFHVVGKIKSKINFYQVHLSNGSSERTEEFEVTGHSDCQITVKRVLQSSPSKI
jgi:hypothetical protein